MSFKLFGVIFVLCIITAFGFGKPLPDSAGVVPKPDGLAYGGIPYGSISGQLSLYFGDYEPILLNNKISGSDAQIL